MQARLQGGDAKGSVLGMGRGDHDGIYRAGLEENMGVSEGLQRLVLFGQGQAATADGDQFATGHLVLEKVIGVEFADVAHADDAKANFVHGRFKI
jgi:hypothetical protein